MHKIVETMEKVTLLGGGASDKRMLADALALAPLLVAADGGANMALRAGCTPQAVIGDFDSIAPEAEAALPAEHLFRVPDQDSTDFEKAIQAIRAPLIVGVGFTGARIDHELAALNALVRARGQRILLLGAADVIFLAPPELDLALDAGERVSLFPMAPVTGESSGLTWPIAGIPFAPDGPVGTSNRAEGPVHLRFHAPGMLVFLERARLGLAADALLAANSWAR